MPKVQRDIKALLVPNTLINSKARYIARTQKYRTYSLKDICERAQKSVQSLDSELMEYYVNLFMEEMMDVATEGNIANVGYFSVKANLKGTFDSINSHFDEKKHKVDFSFTPGVLAHKKAKKLKVEILTTRHKREGITAVYEPNTNNLAYTISSNRNLLIKGYRIKLMGDDPQVGIHLQHTETNEVTTVPKNFIVNNTHGTLLVMLPTLAPGSYQLMITTQYIGNGILFAQPRTYKYAYLLETT